MLSRFIPARNVVDNAKVRKHRPRYNQVQLVKRWALRYRAHEVTAEDVPVYLRESVQLWLLTYPRSETMP